MGMERGRSAEPVGVVYEKTGTTVLSRRQRVRRLVSLRLLLDEAQLAALRARGLFSEPRRRGRPRHLDAARARWQAIWTSAEFQEEFDADDPPATKRQRREALALRDWAAHREDWPRSEWPANPSDPDDIASDWWLRKAGERIRKAL